MRVLAVMPGISPSTVINVMTPLKALHNRGDIEAVIRLEHEVTPSEVAAADRLVLCRNQEPIYQPIYDLARDLGIPMVYDLDDHLLGVPKGSLSYHYVNHPARKAQYERMLRGADLVRVHSPVLRDLVRPYNPNVRLRWAAIDWSLVPPELPPLSLDPLHIVYAAQRESGEKLYRLMQPDLHALLAQHGDRVHLHFLGYNPPDLRGHRSVTCQPFEADYAAFFSRFTRFGYAIGLAPMLDDAFHNSKTNIKFRDYAAAGAAGIYADVPLYNTSVVNGKTGLLVSNEPGSWLAAIERLLDISALLELIRQNARRFCEERYHMDSVGALWLEDLNGLPAPPTIAADKAAQIAAMRWWFTGIKQADKPHVARLRRVLRVIVPMRLKLAYYDLRYALLRRRARR